MPAWFRSLRPRQWAKNLVVFAGLVFGGLAEDTTAIWRAVAAFALFSALSSAVYLLNDVLDHERDRLHPFKRHRPIAAGTFAPGAALALAAALAAAALAGAALLGWRVLSIFAGYLALQVLYGLRLKHVVILDVFCIAAGFLLRVVAGVFAVGAELSPWLVACSVQLALFLALCKRRAEATALGEGDAAQRPALSAYAGPATDLMVSVVASATLVTYTLYTLLPGEILEPSAPALASKAGRPGMIWTLPFVLYGILRYLYLVYGQARGERPERLLTGDRPLLLAVLGFGAVAGAVIYAG
ncbi:MAG TPA: UbiA prenyltransferase family protein [Planctomycetota bacterium]